MSKYMTKIHTHRVEEVGREYIHKIVGGILQPQGWPYDLVSPNGTRLEIKTSLLSETGYTSKRLMIPSGRWRWAHLYGSGKEHKGADRLILVASYRWVHGSGRLLQNPRIYDLDYERVIEALTHPEEEITLALLGGWNTWRKILPASRCDRADLKRRYV